MVIIASEYGLKIKQIINRKREIYWIGMVHLSDSFESFRKINSLCLCLCLFLCACACVCIFAKTYLQHNVSFWYWSPQNRTNEIEFETEFVISHSASTVEQISCVDR